MSKGKREPRTIPEVRWQRNKIGVGDKRLISVYTWTYDGLLVSQGNGRKPDGTWKGGGDFYAFHAGKTATFLNLNWLRNNVTWDGTVGSPNLSSLLPSPPAPTSWATWKAYLDSKYATAYKRARPGNKVADLGQFIGELKDLRKLGKILTGWGPVHKMDYSSLTSIARNLRLDLNQFARLAPGQYLNVEFGWKPFLSDLTSLLGLREKIDDRIKRIINENNRGIDRRSVVLDEDDTVVDSVTTYGYAFAGLTGPPPTWVPGTTVVTVTRRTITKVWFTGRFRYFIPNTSSTDWLDRERLKLVGLDLLTQSPELIWNLLPFSWLIDYFTNVGDIISNASDTAVDNLICDYSYIMCTKRVEIRRTVQTTWQGLYHEGAGLKTRIDAGQATFETVEYTEEKTRRGGGNPFGLGTRFDELSSYQTGILAALGLSRSLVR